MARRTATKRLADLLLRAAGEIQGDDVFEDWLIRQREAGTTYRHIARDLDRRFDLDLAEVTLRAWVDAYRAADAPAAAGGAG